MAADLLAAVMADCYASACLCAAGGNAQHADDMQVDVFKPWRPHV